MALGLGDIALAIAKGATEGAVDVQKARQEKLEKRIKELQKNDLELAKSKHTTKSKEYITRKTNVAAIQAAGDDYGKSFAYYKNIRGMTDADAKVAARSEPVQITDDMINDYIGDEPLLLDDSMVDYSGVEARSVLRDFGFGSDATAPPSVDQQIADARASTAKQMSSAMSVPMKPQVIPEGQRGAVPEYLRIDEKDTRGTLRKKYDDALSIAKERNMENPEEFAFNMVKADKENKDLRGTTRKKFDDLVGIKMESGVPETQARAEAMAEVLREEKDNRSAFQKKFDEKVELYTSIKKISKPEAEKLALADIEQENAINRDIVVPTIMAIANGQKVPASTMAAFQAYNASRQNFFTQAMALGGKGLQQFVAQPGEQAPAPKPEPVPQPTANAMPVEQALAILREKATPEMVQFFIDTYGADKLPPEFQQQ